jgi:alkylhydroperoxidase family enzyme
MSAAATGSSLRPAIARLDFEALAPELQDVLRPRVQRLGYLGEFFRCLGHAPGPLADFVRFSESAKDGLDPALVEVIALTVSVATGNDYERNQHERLCARLGLGTDWVAAVEACAHGAAAPLTEEEGAMQAFVLAALPATGRGAGAALERLRRLLGDAGAAAALLLLGRYLAHSVIVNALALDPPVASIFATAPQERPG